MGYISGYSFVKSSLSRQIFLFPFITGIEYHFLGYFSLPNFISLPPPTLLLEEIERKFPAPVMKLSIGGIFTFQLSSYAVRRG